MMRSQAFGSYKNHFKEGINMPEQNHVKKIALVTGASTGIGKAIALRMAQDGYEIAITYKASELLAKAVVQEIQQHGSRAIAFKCDVTSNSNVTELREEFGRHFDHLNVLVNNAGTDIPKSIDTASFEEWSYITRIKTDGPFLVTKAFLDLLRGADNANIINVTSHEGVMPNPAYVAYGVGTAALIAFTKALSVSLPKDGIRVNGVSPGTVRTPLWEKTGEDSETLWNDLRKKNPMGRVPTVEDVANSVMLLVNDPMRYLNGNFLYVDGGNHHVP
jgi:NAD(P)-dependent dehydrogenase (short-subunit alcohol dehydrogenase family)